MNICTQHHIVSQQSSPTVLTKSNHLKSYTHFRQDVCNGFGVNNALLVTTILILNVLRCHTSGNKVVRLLTTRPVQVSALTYIREATDDCIAFAIIAPSYWNSIV